MEKIEETIKEIAVKHGIAVGRNDPIMILHTINERLMKETAAAQRQILHEFKEELEAAAHQWEAEAKKNAETILNAALAVSKEVITKEGRTVAVFLGREVDSRLAQAGATIWSARILAIINIAVAVLALLTVVASSWVRL